MRPIAAVIRYTKPMRLADAIRRAESLGCSVNEARVDGECPVLAVSIPTQKAANDVALAHFLNEFELHRDG